MFIYNGCLIASIALVAALVCSIVAGIPLWVALLLLLLLLLFCVGIVLLVFNVIGSIDCFTAAAVVASPILLF